MGDGNPRFFNGDDENGRWYMGVGSCDLRMAVGLRSPIFWLVVAVV
jgi:hypothetical protein